MSNRRILGAAALASASMAVALIPSIAVAGPGDTVYVNNHNGAVSSAASAKQNAAGCASTPYSSVQPAVDAAKPGQTVYLCASTTPYSGWVVIQKNLNLTGDPGATIMAPSGAEPTSDFGTFFTSQGLAAPSAIVSVLGKVNVQVNGLTIDGPLSGCGSDASQDFGVLALGGPHVQLNNDSVLHITENSDCVLAFAVDAGAEYWPGSAKVLTANLQVQNTSISNYQDVGVIVDGSGSQGEVMGTTIQGDGTNAADAQVGIVVVNGANGQVHNSVINDNESSPSAGAIGTGVEISGGCDGAPLTKNAHVHDNSFTNNDVGVAVSDFNPASDCSESSQPPPIPAAPMPTNNQIDHNAITKNDGKTNTTPFTDQFGNKYSGYQAGISDGGGNGDDIHDNTISDASSGAYGPQTIPGGQFLVPIDIQTEPTAHVKVHNNTFNGSPTNPPY